MIDLFNLIENNDSPDAEEKLKNRIIHIKGEVNSCNESNTRHLFSICDILLNNKTEVDVQIMNVTSKANSEDLTIRDRVAMRVSTGTTYTYEIKALVTSDMFNLINNEHSTFIIVNSVLHLHTDEESAGRSLFASTFDYSLLDEDRSSLSDFVSWRVHDTIPQPSVSLSMEGLNTPLEPNVPLDAFYATRDYVEDLFESTYGNIPRYRIELNESTGNYTLIIDSNDRDGDRP
jgi:hypothetical protein